MRSSFVAVLLLLCVSCSWSGRNPPSVLVIAVENLGFDLIPCESEQMSGNRDFEGFKIMCEESVRFTHAFTTSPLSQAGIGSLLTGLYPFESGLRHNGNDHLSASSTTAAEAAVENRMRTAFFSGGPPIMRKSGLSQGFEIFDDNFRLSSGRLYRPAKENFDTLLGWLDRDVGHQPFFVVSYLADLQFPEVSTSSDFSEIRERSFDSQLREVGESLGYLIRELRRRKRWDSTNVVLVGLNGNPASVRQGEFAPLDLFAENTQVALLIKPAQKSRDKGIEWKIDRNVSLVDVGATLFEMLGGAAPPAMASDRSLEKVSLTGVLGSAEADWNEDRLILVESAWAKWRDMGGVRYAARKNQYLYIHDHSAKAFNSLIDRMEVVSLPGQDPLWQSLDREVIAFFVERNWAPWNSPAQSDLNRLRGGQRLWSGKADEEAALIYSAREGRLDERQAMWALLIALRHKDWPLLAEMGEKYNFPLATFVAKRRLGEFARLPTAPCAPYFRVTKGRFTKAKGCGDEALMRGIQWAIETNEDRRNRVQDMFFEIYLAQLLDGRLGEQNYAHNLTWDVNPDLPRFTSLAELFLALPEAVPLADSIQSRRSREDQGLDL